MRERHPYGEFIPKRPRCMIIGSFPIGKFSDPRRRQEIRPHEFDFFFGGERNLLWKLLGAVFDRDLRSKDDIVALLEDKGIAVGDVIRSCVRINGGGSDSALTAIEWNQDLLKILRRHRIRKIFFTSKQVGRWFQRLFPDTPEIEKVFLVSPSSQSARGLARNPQFLTWKKRNPKGKIFEYILNIYENLLR